MKSITTKIFLSIMLVFSVIFGGFTISTHAAPVALAIGENTVNGQIDPDDPNITPNIDPSELPEPGEEVPATDDTEDEEGSNPGTPSDPANPSESDLKNTCQSESGVLGWIVCPTTGVLSKFVDGIYSIIHDLLVVKPLTFDTSSSIYQIWQYVRTITNIISAILILIVIYSQITGIGLNNYGIKRVLPRLVIAVILVNLSFHICALAIDVSNIFGANLRGFFSSISDQLFASGLPFTSADISTSSVLAAILSGGTIAGVALSAAGGIGALFWAFIPVLIGGVISVGAGFITIALRQALIALLVMIAPLAFIAYLLPNTEKWFAQWKNLFFRMLVFFPMFSLLFGASQLVGIALISSATNGFGIALGVAVQIIPLFFSVSLMKMSGTILSSINSGIHRLTSPIQRGTTRWAFEHGERIRQNYINTSETPGAHLRKYLDYRRELRLQDTANAVEIRHARAHQRAYIKASSYIGRDDKGNDIWSENPNQYTRNAKTAAYYRTLAGNATATYQSTLAAYGTHFANNSPIDNRLNLEHARAFEESTAQNFLAQNQAQADQEALLQSYLKANNTKYRNRYEYNRLIKNAAGDLGHTGESSIIGQVIATNAMIEDRRKREAEIISTKFGYDKPNFRAMLYDMASISDNGREMNADGIEIEDEQYNLLKDKHGNPYQRRKYPHYIGVHKITKNEITKAEYDALPDKTTRYADGTIKQEGKDAYNRIRYCDILDDNGDPTGTAFMDDPGYMKVLIAKDIAIGDPINDRYITTLGVPHTEYGETGGLRRYHSTITANLLSTKYKDHDAAVTGMLTAQADRGFIVTKSHANLARIQSLTAAGKAGSFLKNDGVIIDEYIKYIQAINDDVLFDKFFPIEDIWTYRNVNGIELDGWRLATDENGNKYWQVINHNDPNITREDRKNLVRHKILPKFAAKLVGMLNRNITPGVLEDMKPDGLASLENLLDTLSSLAIENASADKLFEERMNGDYDIFDSSDPSILKTKVRETQRKLRNLKNPPTPPDDGGNPPNGNNPPSGNSGNNGGGNNGGGSNGNSGGNNNNPPTPPSDNDPNDDSDDYDNGPSGGNHGSSNGPRPSSPSSSSSSNSPHYSSSSSQSNPYRRPSFNQLHQRNERLQDARTQYEERNSYETIMSSVNSFFEYAADYEVVADQLLDYFQEVEVLQIYADDCKNLIDDHRYEPMYSTDDAVYNTTHMYEIQAEHLDELHDDIVDLIDSIKTY